MDAMTTRPKSVLVCYDGSESAHRALDEAARLMGYGSRLAVASVARNGELMPNAVLSEARERLLQRHLTATYLPLHGDPADELVETAFAIEADLVVVGRRNENRVPRTGLGPVSADVMRRTPCDVLVVR